MKNAGVVIINVGRCTKIIGLWLHLTYNRCINHLKKRRLVFFEEVPEQIRTAEENVTSEGSTDEDGGFSEKTLKALSHLKPADRALVYGKVMDERSYEEMAQELNASPAALRKRYERARKKLAKHLTAADG